MRTIKFRFWDRSSKKMYEPDFVATLDFESKCAWVKERYKGGRWLYFNNADLMQFTGLHDKSGREIYEGDIVEERWDNPLAGGVNIDRYKINFAENSLYRMDHSSGEKQWDRFLFMRYQYVEVIGNIYESPELLK